MATATFSHATHAEDTEIHLEQDHGPWLFLAAPLSFALTLGMVIYFSLTSF